MASTKSTDGSVVQSTMASPAAGTTIGKNATESALMELVVVKIGGHTLRSLVENVTAANARLDNRSDAFIELLGADLKF